LTVFEFEGGVSEVIVFAGGEDSGVIRGEGLYEDFSGTIAATGTSGYLGDELKGFFAGAEIGKVECGIGLDDTDEQDVWEV
jgi:hypothetical protein